MDGVTGALGEAGRGVGLGKSLAELLEEFRIVRCAGLELDAGVDVLGVLTKDHHVDFFRVTHG